MNDCLLLLFTACCAKSIPHSLSARIKSTRYQRDGDSRASRCLRRILFLNQSSQLFFTARWREKSIKFSPTFPFSLGVWDGTLAYLWISDFFRSDFLHFHFTGDDLIMSSGLNLNLITFSVRKPKYFHFKLCFSLKIHDFGFAGARKQTCTTSLSSNCTIRT